jgi:RimJ/RimL family protein N-acetyltransferase
MDNRPLFRGEYVRLAAVNPDTDLEDFCRWSLNSEYLRLLDSDPARPRTSQFFQRRYDQPGNQMTDFSFAIRTLDEDRLIGQVELDEIEWPHASGWISIGIGDPDYWNKGYGTDAMKELLRFAFMEVGLYRVSLNVFEYNQRALHLYQKLGFQVEGRIKGYLQRDGKRWDLIYLGLLKPEWQDPS